MLPDLSIKAPSDASASSREGGALLGSYRSKLKKLDR